MKKLSFILLFIVNGSFAQLMNSSVTKTEDLQKSVDLLIQNLQLNSDNPLQLDNSFLSNLSQQITDPSLKNLLESYSSNLGTDGDLSYRQIYWDVSNAFKQNPILSQDNQFLQTVQGLDVMFNNYTSLSDAMQSSGGNLDFGMFVTDPDMISSLSNITGSYESAQALGLGIQFLASLAKEIQANQKYKEDYSKLARLSSTNVYVEKDINLNGAFIDGYVGVESFQVLTPMYRYDFDNGASIRVEKGILKYFNLKKGIVKDLLVVDERHDGQFYQYSDLRMGYYAAINVSPDESVFYLFVNDKPFSDIKCKTCLKKTGYTINSETGEIIFTQPSWRIAPWGSTALNQIHFNKNNVPLVYSFSAWGNNFYTSGMPFTSEEQFGNNIGVSSFLDNRKSFKINNETLPFERAPQMNKSIFDMYVNSHYLFTKDSCTLSLFWARNESTLTTGAGMIQTTTIPINETTYVSSMVQTAKNDKAFNADGLVNELTGIAMSKNGDLFVTGRNGSIGTLNASEYKLDDPMFASKVRKVMDKKVFETYDFNASKEYVTGHGNIATQSHTLYPSLKLTPDDKYLIYILKDNFYLIDPKNLTKVKHYKLSCHPYNTFFTKESGGWVVNIMAFNEFKFPITKKYSLEKMNSMELESINPTPPANTNKPNTTKTNNTTKTTTSTNTSSSNSSPSNTNSSLADEIKKLKELFDAGAITQEEFTAAKAQLLNSSANTTSNTTNNSNNTTTNSTSSTAKTSKKVHTFEINGKSYCAVNASESGLDIYGLYKYLGKEIRTYDSKEGEPIVQLDKTDKPNNNDDCVGKSGLWQAHGERAKPITWWLSSDCNGNVEVITTENFRRYNIVVRYEEEDEPGHSNYPKGSYDFMSLSIYTDGSNKVLILGERVKQ